MLPSFQIEGKLEASVLKDMKPVIQHSVLKNKVTEYLYTGTFKNNPSAVFRFQYSIRSLL